jgi:hypothetical protein
MGEVGEVAAALERKVTRLEVGGCTSSRIQLDP